MIRRGIKRMFLLLAIFLLLSGCTGGIEKQIEDGSSQIEQEITISWWGDENRNEYTQELLERYEKQHPGIRFQPVFLPEEDYGNYLAVAAAAGECPDIMLMDSQLLNIFSKNQSLADCGETLQRRSAMFFREEEIPDRALINAGKREEVQVGIPVSYSVPVLFCHTGRLQEAGMELTENMDWNAFKKACIFYRDRTGELGFVYRHENSRLLLYWMEQKGTPLYREGRLSLGTQCKPALLSYFTFCDELLRNKAMAPPMKENEKSSVNKVSREEKGAFYFGDMPALWEWQEIEVMFLPEEELMRAKPELFFSLSASLAGKKKETAEDFISWFLSDTYAVTRAGLERGIPASGRARELLEESENLLPAEKSLLSFSKTWEKAGSVSEEVPEKLEETDRIYREVIVRMYQDGISPEKAAEDFYQHVSKLVSEQEATDEDKGKIG